jgi:hypothetical protein
VGLIGSGCAARTGTNNQVFTDRIADYLNLRGDAVRQVGRVEETDDPAELRDDIVELSEEIQSRRQGAREGDILGGAVADDIRASLRALLSRRDGPRIVAEIMDVQPAPFSPMINTRYPGDQPRSTMPGPLLRVLPRLPTELSYRFVGRHLILLDGNTGLIIDVLHDAIPQGGPQTEP